MEDRRAALHRDAEIRRLDRVKRSSTPAPATLGEAMIRFFKESVEKRQTKMGKIAQVWAEVIPALLDEHCCLESLNRGTLTVLVDSSSHLYELKHILLAGLQKEILAACRSTGLRKISLKPGRWYEDVDGQRRVEF